MLLLLRCFVLITIATRHPLRIASRSWPSQPRRRPCCRARRPCIAQRIAQLAPRHSSTLPHWSSPPLLPLTGCPGVRSLRTEVDARFAPELGLDHLRERAALPPRPPAAGHTVNPVVDPTSTSTSPSTTSLLRRRMLCRSRRTFRVRYRPGLARSPFATARCRLDLDRIR